MRLVRNVALIFNERCVQSISLETSKRDHFVGIVVGVDSEGQEMRAWSGTNWMHDRVH